MATLRDVAEAAGVSLSVASRALNADPSTRMAASTRARIVEIAAALHYVPNERSRNLRFSRSGAIALVVPSVTNSVFAALVDGVGEVAKAHRSAVYLAQLSEGQPGSLAALLGEGRVDGAILQRAEHLTERELVGLLDVQLPLVLFNSRIPDRPGSVILDDASAVGLATSHLLALGHRRIAFLGGAETHDAAARRRTAFLDLMEREGIAVRPEHVVSTGWEADAGEHGVRAILSATVEPPTAVLVASVNAAIGAAGAALRAGLDVPGRLSIVAIQDSWIARAFHPAITVAKLPLQEAGHAAAQLLFRMIDGGAANDLVITEPPPQLIIRESTAAPGV